VLSLRTTSACRSWAAPLAATWTSTWPGPCPDAGVIAEIQLAEVEAVHVHSASVEMSTRTSPPPEPTVPGLALSESAHLTGVGDVDVDNVADDPHRDESSALPTSRKAHQASRGRPAPTGTPLPVRAVGCPTMPLSRF
jgi:hypothetical protein